MRSIQWAVAVSLVGSVVAQDTPTNPPNPGFVPCEVCGEGRVITNPSGQVSFPGQPIFTCPEVAEAGLMGFIDPGICPNLFAFLGDCNCDDATMAPIPTMSPSRAPVTPFPTATTVPTGIVPTESPAPSPNPTETGAPSPVPTNSPRPSPVPTITEIPSSRPTESPAPSPSPSIALSSSPTVETPSPTESPFPSPSPSGLLPTSSPVPSDLPTSPTASSQPSSTPSDQPSSMPSSAQPSGMPSFPETPAPSIDCGMRDEACAKASDCCSNSCQNKPGEIDGTCVSIKSASKNDVKLGNGFGGAGGRIKA